MRKAGIIAIVAAAFSAAAPGQQGAPPVKGPPASGAPARQPSRPARPDKTGLQPLREHAQARVESILTVLGDDGDFAKAKAQLQEFFDVCVAYAPESEADAFAAAAAALRTVSHLSALPQDARRPLLEYLRSGPALARELAFAIAPEDNVAAAYGILDRLRGAYTDKPAALPELTAAICVVHDRPRRASVSPAPPAEPVMIDPVEVFGYFLRNEGMMGFGLRDLPPELLVYTVDTQATPEELRWAAEKHEGDRNVGARYDDLAYDTAHFKYNKPKKIAAMEYSLPNLRKVGGVCAEQAYYAAHVARAIGVPATEISGRSSDLSHVWVGFLQGRGGRLVWNTEEGHYDKYKDLEGWVIDPQRGRAISDSALALTAEVARTPVASRHGAAALVDASRRLARLAGAKDYPPPPPPGVGGLRSAPRRADARGRLELLKGAGSLSPASAGLWEAVREAAPVMSGADRAAWFEVLINVCGDRHRRYAYQVMVPMIESIPGQREQSEAWEWAFQAYRQIPGLAADARMRLGRMWEGAGDRSRAYAAYVDVAHQFPNDGTFAVDALAQAEEMLRKAGKHAAAVEMYKDAWRRISRPDSVSTGFYAMSNFFRVGERYADSLDRVGRGKEAQAVRRQIEAGFEKDK